jgi:hypothetical protein
VRLSGTIRGFLRGFFRRRGERRTIYAVDDESPADQALIATKNLSLPEGESRARPLCKKGFAYSTKGGAGGIRTRPADAVDTRLFPAGPAYRYVPLK